MPPGGADLQVPEVDLATPAANDLAPEKDLLGATLRAYVGVGAGQVLRYQVNSALRQITPEGSDPAGSNPSFLAFNAAATVAYAVEEGAAAVQALAIAPGDGALSPLNRLTGLAAGPVHVTLDREGRHALIASYTGGAITVVALEADGRLGAVSDRRATGAQAHCVGVDPSGGFVFVPNKGADTISQFRYAAATGVLTANTPAQVATAAGAGPRHIDFHPGGRFAYVVNEVDDTVVAYSLSAAGVLAPLQSISTLPAGVDGASNTGAEIAVAPSGRFVYASNRGHNSIVIYTVDAQTGRLTLLGHQTSGGRTPRHFSLADQGRLLLVANQDSRAVALFRVDTGSGLLTPLASADTTGAPAWVGAVVR